MNNRYRLTAKNSTGINYNADGDNKRRLLDDFDRLYCRRDFKVQIFDHKKLTIYIYNK